MCNCVESASNFLAGAVDRSPDMCVLARGFAAHAHAEPVRHGAAIVVVPSEGASRGVLDVLAARSRVRRRVRDGPGRGRPMLETLLSVHVKVLDEPEEAEAQ